MDNKFSKLSICLSKVASWWMDNGFWKFLFVLYSALICYLSFGGLMSQYQVTEFNIAIGWILTVQFVLVGGYFYALGWNKKFYSLKASGIIFTTLMSSAVLFCIFSIYITIPQVMVRLKILGGENAIDSQVQLVAILISVAYYLAVYLIINIPVVIAYIKYKKRNEQMVEVKKPYWKLFLTYFAATYILSFYHLLIFSDKSLLNPLDYLFIVTNIFDALLLLFYAYSIKLGKQRVWKILSVPYLLFNIALFFLASEHLLQLSNIQLITESVVALVVGAILTVGFYYIFYRYAFSKDVYAEQVSENDNQEV